jgi:hypothetical protein
VHAHAAVDAHEIKHLRPFKARAGRTAVFAVVDVLRDDVAVVVLVVAVDGGLVIDVLLDHAILAGPRVIAFLTGGDGRSTHHLPVL